MEETGIFKKIAGVLGVTISKKSKKDGSSPKPTTKGKSSGKSGTAKKKTGQSAALEMASSMANKQFVVNEPIPEPMFRYVPDRDTIQRLLHKVSNMKDDLTEFELFDDK